MSQALGIVFALSFCALTLFALGFKYTDLHSTPICRRLVSTQLTSNRRVLAEPPASPHDDPPRFCRSAMTTSQSRLQPLNSARFRINLAHHIRGKLKWDTNLLPEKELDAWINSRRVDEARILQLCALTGQSVDDVLPSNYHAHAHATKTEGMDRLQAIFRALSSAKLPGIHPNSQVSNFKSPYSKSPGSKDSLSSPKPPPQDDAMEAHYREKVDRFATLQDAEKQSELLRIQKIALGLRVDSLKRLVEAEQMKGRAIDDEQSPLKKIKLELDCELADLKRAAPSRV
jgi:hypothetical protein